MTFTGRVAIVIVLGFAIYGRAATDSPDRTANLNLPFSIEATDNVAERFPGAPRLQSFAWAQWEGKWIFISGRSGGYHGVGGLEADFPRATANENIWVVDPSGAGPAKTYSLPLASLPASLAVIKDQWASTSTLFVQDGETLYLAGGYGQNSQGAWVTYPILSAVNLPALVSGVMQGKNTFSGSIAYTESPLVQSTGGELLKLDDGMLYLIGGHVFTGSYRAFEASEEKSSADASQVYLGEIRKLRVQRAHGKLSVALVERFQDPEFARRDLNAALTILPDGRSLGAGAYGGVFTKEQSGFVKPIYFSGTGAPKADGTFEQKMSAYTCAKLLLFDPDTGNMLTTFFGGISGYTWNPDNRQFELAPHVGDKSSPVYLDGLTWTDQITTLIHGAKGTFETVQSKRMAGYLGTNSAFLPVAELKRVRPDADVFDLRPLRGKRTLVGYLYGGIRAYPREFPYLETSQAYNSGNVPTKPSDVIVPVYITVPAAK